VFRIWRLDLLDAAIKITVYYNSSHIELFLNDVCLRYLSLLSETWRVSSLSNSGSRFGSLPESESYVMTERQSASLSWYKAPIRGLWPGFYFRTEYRIRLIVTFLIPWEALSDERTGLSFVRAGGPCQRSLSRVLVPWDLRPYFTVSDLRLPFSSPPTTRRVTVAVFDPASTRVGSLPLNSLLVITARRPA
jgi:hypothetical protein